MEESNSLPNANIKAYHDSRHVLLALCLNPPYPPISAGADLIYLLSALIVQPEVKIIHRLHSADAQNSRSNWVHSGHLGYRQ